MNPYEVLKIKPTASQKEVKKAYYELIKKNHPDVNSSVDAQVKTQIIIEAYTAIIGDENIVESEVPRTTPFDHFSDKFICDICSGTGIQEKILCEDCFGFGLVKKKIKSKRTFNSKKCNKCKGRGYAEPLICEKCQGFGVIKG